MQTTKHHSPVSLIRTLITPLVQSDSRTRINYSKKALIWKCFWSFHSCIWYNGSLRMKRFWRTGLSKKHRRLYDPLKNIFNCRVRYRTQKAIVACEERLCLPTSLLESPCHIHSAHLSACCRDHRKTTVTFHKHLHEWNWRNKHDVSFCFQRTDA